MENILHPCYTMVHETSGNRATAGKASPTGNPVVKSGQEPVGSSKRRKLLREFGVSMVSVVSKTGVERAATPTNAWPTAQTYQIAKRQADQAVAERPFSRRLSDRYVDLATCDRSNRRSIRHSLPSIPCLETPRQYEVELPEAGTTSPTTGRRENSPLEALPIPSYKKTRHNVGPIWYFLMKAAFCSSLRSDAHGRQRERRRSFITSTNRTGYPPSAPLRYPRKESISLCISGIRPRILTALMSAPFSHHCLSIFAGQWSSSGMADQSIFEKKSNSILPGIGDFTSNGFLHMLRNSTRRNMCGTRPTVLSLTARRKTCQNSAACCADPSANYEVRRSSSGLAFMHPSCHGPDDNFHYLCKAQ